MIITIASFKGGVGKTTTAVHLAAFLQRRAPTLLIDGDDNRSATSWTQRGGLPFKVVDYRQGDRFVGTHKHTVIDTEPRPDDAELRTLAGMCDLLIIPSTPDAMALEALLLAVDAFMRVGVADYRVLLTMIPPRPSRDGDEARAMLRPRGLPLFKGEIRRRVAFQKAALAGVTVDAAPDVRAAEAWADYEKVGRELLK